MLNKLNLKRYINDETGVSLLIAVMTLFVLSIIGVTLATVTFANIKLSTTDREFQSAYYIAEAGVNQAYAEIRDEILEIYDNSHTDLEFYDNIESALLGTPIDEPLISDPYENFDISFGEQPEANVFVSKIEEEHSGDYLIRSEGKIGERKRTVTKNFKVNWVPKGGSTPIPSIPEGMAAIVKSKLYLNNLIRGNVYIASGESESVEMSWSGKIDNGTLYAPADRENDMLKIPDHFSAKPPIQTSDVDIDFSVFEHIVNNIPDPPVISNVISSIPQDKILILNKDSIINDITIGGGETLTIDTNGKTIDLVVNNLYMSSGGGYLKLEENSKLNLFINNTFSLGGSSKINKEESSENLNIYYSGYNPLTFPNEVKVYGTIYNKNAEINFQGGQSTIGNIVSPTNRINLNNGATVTGLFIAPYANIKIEGGTIKGAVIVNELMGQNGGGIELQNLPFPDLPTDNEDGNGGNGEEDTGGDLITPGPNIE